MKKHSVCPLDCPDRCSLEVEVREDRVVSIEGSHHHPLTAGFICTKVRRFPKRLYGPDRLLYPQRRVGPKGSGKFERISWEEAIETIASKLRFLVNEFGGESILPFFYGGSNGLMTQGLVDEHFFRRLGATRLARTVCSSSATAALRSLYGGMPGVAFEDYRSARFILFWGANPNHSNIHLMPYVKEARQEGAKIAVVDPREILGSNLVDFRLQPVPGTDLVVALGIINHLEKQGLVDRAFLEEHATGYQELLDRAGEYPLEKASKIAQVPAGDIALLAETYAEADPALLRCGWGLERNRNGLASMSAVLALPAVAGKFGKVGGGFTLSSSGAYRINADTLAGIGEPSTRVLNMNRLGRHLTEELSPPLKALIVYNCNPAVTVPHQNLVLEGLEREDLFTVLMDQVHTDTADYADILLPATTFLEHREIHTSYGAFAVQMADPVVQPSGQSKSNADMFQLLGQAMGWTDGVFAEDQDDLLRRTLEAIEGRVAPALRPDSLSANKIVHLDFPGKHPVQFVTVFPNTPGEKIRLFDPGLGPRPYDYLDNPSDGAFPLILISPASNKTVTSTLGEFNYGDAKLEINPQDAADRGLDGGEKVRVFNDLGEVHCSMQISPALRRGVVCLAKGMWRRASLNGKVGSSLVPDDLTPVSGGACFNDARVEVERLRG